MVTAIHIELDLICLFILEAIARLSHSNVNQQMKRVLFRNVIYGIIITLTLDCAWLLIDGKLFPGAIILNKVTNALFLGMGVLLGGVWYLYVLCILNYRVNKRLMTAVLTPGILFMILNILSIWTGWMFTINEANEYVRGSLFWLQTIGSVGMLLTSLVHIVICTIRGRKGISNIEMRKLLQFYVIPVAGTLISLPYTGMPGTWTCAAASIVLIYLEDQDKAILTDGLTGLNNRNNLSSVFEEYVHQQAPEKHLYLFMIDLDDFKQINDELGHSVGDQALVEAAKLIRKAASGLQAVAMRYGGDEFLIMGFFENDEAALEFKHRFSESFITWNKEHDAPYRLATSIGYNAYKEGQTLEEFINSADEKLYNDKRKHKYSLQGSGR